MRRNIYVSTSAFKVKSLKSILEICLAHGLTNVELSSNVDYADDNLDVVYKFSRNGRMRFLVHNYFPRPKEDFVLNLASDDERTIRQSLEHCYRAIDLSAELKAPFFSVHAGFALHALPKDLGRPLTENRRILYQTAYENFVENVKVVADYAAKRKMNLLLENNVVARFNLVEGKNILLLLADVEETLRFHQDINSDHLFYLVDMGHLKVSSVALGFDREDYLKKITPFTLAFHLSENDGLSDQSLAFDEQVWFKAMIRQNKEKIFVLEIANVPLEEMKTCCLAVESLMN